MKKMTRLHLLLLLPLEAAIVIIIICMVRV